MTKKFFGKRFVAMLTTLAILISMVAMIGSFAVSADTTPYTPKRVITSTVTEKTAFRIALYNTIALVGEKSGLVVKGHYKVENFTAAGDVCYGYINLGGATYEANVAAIRANTEGWQSFEINNYTTSDGIDTSGWVQFGFTNAKGVFSIADVTIETADGEVLYDMTTDPSMANWYMDVEKVDVDPVYVAPYEPQRVITSTLTEKTAFRIALYNTIALVGEKSGLVVKGHYKVENFTAAGDVC